MSSHSDWRYGVPSECSPVTASASSTAPEQPDDPRQKIEPGRRLHVAPVGFAEPGDEQLLFLSCKPPDTGYAHQADSREDPVRIEQENDKVHQHPAQV